MYKKPKRIFLKRIMILFLIMIFSLYTFLPKEKVNADVGSKVVSFAAKKAMKEVVKDGAVRTMGSLALKEMTKETAENYTKKEGFKLICLKGGSNGVCSKAMNVKDVNSLTSVEKKRLGDEVENQIEKAINGGKPLTKWQSFLDFFIPVYTIAGISTIVSGTLDSSMTEYLSEIGYDALNALGWLISSSPLNPGNAEVINSTGDPVKWEEDLPVTEVTTNTTIVTLPTIDYQQEFRFPTINNKSMKVSYNSPIGYKDAVIVIEGGYSAGNPLSKFGDMNLTFFDRTYAYVFGLYYGLYFSAENPSSPGSMYKFVKDGVVIKDFFIPNTSTSIGYHELKEELKELQTAASNFYRLVFSLPTLKSDGFYYQTFLLQTTDNVIYKVEKKISSLINTFVKYDRFDFNVAAMTGLISGSMAFKIGVYSDSKLVSFDTYNPSFPDIKKDFNLPKDSPFVSDGKLNMPPINTLPLKDKETGDKVTLVPDGDKLIPTLPNGQPVPEENVVPDGDYEIIQDPNGDLFVKPPATADNPNPDKIPIGTGPPTPGAPEKPDSNKWGKKFKTLVTTKFPFSLPWDFFTILSFLNADPEVPRIVVNEKYMGMPFKFDITLNQLDPYIKFFRAFVVIGFTINLVLITRKLLGGAQ